MSGERSSNYQVLYILILSQKYKEIFEKLPFMDSFKEIGNLSHADHL